MEDTTPGSLFEFARGLELGGLLGGVEEEQRLKQRYRDDIWFLEKPQHASSRRLWDDCGSD